MNFCECGCGKECKNKFVSGHNRRGTKRSSEWIEMIRNIMLTNNPMKNPNTVEKMVQSSLGKKLSENHKRKISQGNKGHKVSLETRLKIGRKNKGKIPTEEVRRKISEKNKGNVGCWKGKTFSEKHRLNLSKSLKGKKGTFLGRKHSEESKEKMKLAKLGKSGTPCTEERKRKIGLANSGPNSAHWKGGISCEPYCDAWADKEYKKSILERDNYECQNPNCAKNNNRLLIHHIDYIKKNCTPWNLITLCGRCNSVANFNREKCTEFYQNILAVKHMYSQLSI